MDKLKSLLTKKLTPEQQKKEDAEFADFLKLKKAYDEYTKLSWESASISGKYPRGKFIHMKDDREKVEALGKRIRQLEKENPLIPTDSSNWAKIEKRWKGRKYGGTRSRRSSRKRTSKRKSIKKRSQSKKKKSSRKKRRSLKKKSKSLHKRRKSRH